MNWDRFVLNGKINEDARTKHVALCLTERDTDAKAVVLLERLQLPMPHDLTLLRDLTLVERNDIYAKLVSHAEGLECKLIFPATAAHIAKYSAQERRLVRETADMHRRITRPYYSELREEGQTAWINNIIADVDELERRVHDDKCPHTGFIIVPDSKWTDETDIASLYLLVIVRRHDLWSVRDLTAAELPLLKAIRSQLQRIFSPEQPRYQLADGRPVRYDHLRVYLHYPPTYPHLHVHVVFAGNAATQNGAAVGQAILLDDIIDNIECVSGDYYSDKRTLTMQFGVESELYRRLTRYQQ